MILLKTAPRPSSQLNRGTVLLASAQTINVNSLKPRFDAFVDVHRRYIEAQSQVEEAAALERAELEHVAELDGAHDRAITELAAALMLDGEPRRNPFARFAERGPGRMSGLGMARKLRATHDLVFTLRNSPGVSETALAAAEKAEQAAVEVETALSGWNLRQAHAAIMRQARDALTPQWKTAYTALRHLARSMVEERQLYATLFRRMPRSGRKAGREDLPPRSAELPEAVISAPPAACCVNRQRSPARLSSPKSAPEGQERGNFDGICVPFHRAPLIRPNPTIFEALKPLSRAASGCSEHQFLPTRVDEDPLLRSRTVSCSDCSTRFHGHSECPTERSWRLSCWD